MEASPTRPPTLWIALVGLTLMLSATALWTTFSHAPVEATMGVVQKIFYFHVPSAYAMYIGFGLCGLSSLVFLFRRKPSWDALAVASAEVGLIFCIVVLVTGPLWARKAWGTFWTWDPRLTTTLLTGMIFAAYVVLRSFGGSGEAERRFASALGFLGVLILPIIHYAVKLWRGQHPVVIASGGGGLAPGMLHALLVGFVFFTALCALMIWTRFRTERNRQALEALEEEAAERGLLEDL